MHKMCTCCKAVERRTRRVGGCERHKEKREVLEEEMRDVDECDMEGFGTLNSSEKTIAILGDKWWPPAAKQEADKTITGDPS